MAYDENFYRMYSDYLSEPIVVRQHRRAIKLLTSEHPREFESVLDLGCGRHQEFRRYGPQHHYYGVDENIEESKIFGQDFVIRGDYRDLRWLAGNFGNDGKQTDPRSFVSLFSSEITASPQANEKLYRSLFGNFHLRVGLVSGFFYLSKVDQNPVEEAGGVVSWQTLGYPEVSHIYSETRLVLPVPSRMFGADVYEVWRLLERK